MSWYTRIGLEVHAQLATRSKLFCACATDWDAPPNTRTCAVCTGQPGSLPLLNAAAVELAVRAGVALGARVHQRSRFARKHYHYVDLPKAYQITQWDEPLCSGGALPLAGGGQALFERIHLEEDAGRSVHTAEATRIDLNRAGLALIEIVSLPTLESAEEALDCLRSLRELLRWNGISRAEMEKGELRCDVNVSVTRDPELLGTKVEIKNLNSFRHVAMAIEHEQARQIALLEAGGTVEPETRRLVAETGRTEAMRGKEETADYRYLLEPDLPPLRLGAGEIERQRGFLPEPPASRRERFMREWGLSPGEAQELTRDRERAEWFEGVVRSGAAPRSAAKWITNELAAALADDSLPARGFDQLPCTPRELAALLVLVEEGGLARHAARRILAHLVREGGDPARIAHQLGLDRKGNDDEIEAACREALSERPDAAHAYREGNRRAIGALIGAARARGGEHLDPRDLRRTLARLLEGEDNPQP